MDIKITGLDETLKKLDALAKAGSAQENARRWAAMRCPIHHKAPTNVRVVGDRVQAGFCCESFRASAVAATKDAIRGALR